MLHGLEQIATGIFGAASLRLASRRPRYCQAPPVLELQIGIVAKEIRRADCAIGFRHFLCGVEKIREGKVFFPGNLLHVLERILFILVWIIGHDGDGIDAQFTQLAGIPHQTVEYGLHIGAVIADEHHQQPLFPPAIFQCPDLSICAGKGEINGRLAKITYGCLQGNHGCSLGICCSIAG